MNLKKNLKQNISEFKATNFTQVQNGTLYTY